MIAWLKTFIAGLWSLIYRGAASEELAALRVALADRNRQLAALQEDLERANRAIEALRSALAESREATARAAARRGALGVLDHARTVLRRSPPAPEPGAGAAAPAVSNRPTPGASERSPARR